MKRCFAAKSLKNKGWISWYDWLGAGMNRNFRSFYKARFYIRNLKLKNSREWFKYVKSGKKPPDIPACPSSAYKNKGWVDIRDWLGVSWQKGIKTYRSYKSFKEARFFVRKLKLKSWKEWKKYSVSNKKPPYIPTSPYAFYRNKGWVSMSDWIGFNLNKRFISFKEARSFVRKLGLKKGDEWRKYARSGKKPYDIPAHPFDSYKNKGWTNLYDWLGTTKKSS